MAIQYTIQAEVVNIRSDLPKPDDAFLVDTNVWYWMIYSRAGQADQPPKPYQLRDYPAYIRNARQASAKLYRCGLSLAELAHQIEQVEREIFIRSNRAVGTKEFRHNYASERAGVVAEIQTTWGQIKTMAAPLEALIDEATTDHGCCIGSFSNPARRWL